MKSLKLGLVSAVGIIITMPVIALSTTYAASTTAASTPATSTSASTTAADNLASIISRGDNEITRRLSTLDNLDPLISSSTKLSAGDKATLTSAVNNETSGLTTLKTTLDACTTLVCAHTNASDIFSGYRVYALVVPQVGLMNAADHQQQVEAGLSQIATQLATRVTSTSSASLQADLATLSSNVSAAQTLSSNVESSVIGLQPTDYNSNHSVLVQYQSDLKTAAKDNQNSITQVKNILKGL